MSGVGDELRKDVIVIKGKLEGWKAIQDMSSEQFSESEIEIVKGEDESWIDIVADYFRQVHLFSR